MPLWPNGMQGGSAGDRGLGGPGRAGGRGLSSPGGRGLGWRRAQF